MNTGDGWDGAHNRSDATDTQMLEVRVRERGASIHVCLGYCTTIWRYSVPEHQNEHALISARFCKPRVFAILLQAVVLEFLHQPESNRDSY